MFLDASKHLYKRLCLHVRLSVGPSVRRFSNIAEIKTHRTAFLVEIQENSAKFIGRIVVRIELVLGSHLLPHFVYL